MNQTIKKQILAIRDSGETNMFDIPIVTSIALREGYSKLVDYLEKDKEAYVHFILTGEDKTK
ncbi:hypothetical protein CM240_0671 [Clostridium bornimense]|jgi:hypothetical protein|uniref:DUF5049 domain-containing protein n=1 Tax=Clostridium bornimense TaxID=1216932 RepID=W6RT84_9CLOT|nr:DUF5049 domain-containing protein [Clostridium bornimense]CDM67836.1 hypothetical protein CM240_0671 [Clostridium bornimense]